MSIVVGTMIPQISIFLKWELELLAEQFGFTLAEICQLQLNAVKHCFLPEAEKNQLFREMEKELAAYR